MTSDSIDRFGQKTGMEGHQRQSISQHGEKSRHSANVIGGLVFGSVQARMTAAMINVLLSFGSELYTLHHLAVPFYELRRVWVQGEWESCGKSAQVALAICAHTR